MQPLTIQEMLDKPEDIQIYEGADLERAKEWDRKTYAGLAGRFKIHGLFGMPVSAEETQASKSTALRDDANRFIVTRNRETGTLSFRYE